MRWEEFQTHGESPEMAFEALVSMLFERWCRREYEKQLSEFVFVGGAGGDGGVEAYATLVNGDIIGLQAKWYRTGVKSKQFANIRSSITTAISVRPRLVRYIVAIPRNLTDKRLKGGGKTERFKWNGVLSEFRSSNPGTEIVLWGESRIETLLAELGSDGLHRYWFAKTALRIEDLQTRHEQAQSSWLRNRYSPDIHAAGQIEDDLRSRSHGLDLNEAKRHIEKVVRALKKAADEIRRLSRYPSFTCIHESNTYQEAAVAVIEAAVGSQTTLLQAFNSGVLSPLVAEEPEPATRLNQLLSILPAKTSLGEIDRFGPIRDSIKEAIQTWDQQSSVPHMLEWQLNHAIYLGSPGAGKTHALAYVVGSALAKKQPAVLIRARSFDGNTSFEELLRFAAGEPSWSQTDIMDAFEGAASLATIRSVALTDRKDTVLPTRAIVAVDGLDESTNAHEWGTTIGASLPLRARWPRVLFVFTARPSLINSLPNAECLPRIHINNSNAKLTDVFSKHIQTSAITVSPAVQWALRTPLAIQLFAELYRERHVEYDPQTLTIEKLLDKKITHVENQLRQSGDWTAVVSPVRCILLAIVRGCLKIGRALNDTEALDRAEAAIQPKGAIPRSTLLTLLSSLADYGLLLRTVTKQYPLAPEIGHWEPAYETLTDYLLAVEATSAIEESSPGKKQLPDYLQNRAYAVELTIALLGLCGFEHLSSGLWSESLSQETVEQLKRTALYSAAPNTTPTAIKWVSKNLIHDMPSCRCILNDLILPGLRLPDYPYSARLVHNILCSLSVAERDLVWSGPSSIPSNCGGQWEGEGPDLNEHLSWDLELTDSSDTAPLLCAWMTCSTDQRWRRRLRSTLAKWSSQNPIGVQELLAFIIDSDDPQMLEDSLTSIYGASLMASSDKEWANVCDWLSQNAEQLHRISPYNVVVYQRARAIQEYWRWVGIWNKPGISMPSAKVALSLDQTVAESENPDCNPITSADLAWYVVPRSYELFFKEGRVAAQLEGGATLLDLDHALIKAFSNREIRVGASAPCVAAATRELRRRENIWYIQGVQEKLKSQGHDVIERELGRWYDKLPVEEQEALNEATELGDGRNGCSTGNPETVSRKLAQDTLDLHTFPVGAKRLSPAHLAFAYVCGRVRSLGWSEETHLMSPNGGKAGELLGADIAILRGNQRATHGERSDVATFREKYVWLACHELTGYLARCLPVERYSRLLEPPVDPSNFVDSATPAIDALVISTPNDNAGVFLSNLISDNWVQNNSQLPRSDSQFALANSWVSSAPVPSPSSFLHVESGSGDWLVLHTWASNSDNDTMADSMIWASAATIPVGTSDVVQEDLVAGFLDLERLSDFHSGIETIGTYADPLEVIWAPWPVESDSTIEHQTITQNGDPTTIPLRTTATNICFNGIDGETTLYIPAKWLREALHIVRFQDGKFYDAEGEVVACFHADPVEALMVRRPALDKILKDKNQELIWGFRNYREPDTSLCKDDWPRVKRDFRALAIWSNGAVESTTVINKLTEFPPRYPRS